MGYAFYYVGDRPAGYGVLATCDKRGCENEIDRGLGYLCGTEPHKWSDAADGCGFYFCGDHASYLGLRGGCAHRQRKAWGKTLSCMEQGYAREDDTILTYCLYRAGHDGEHAWKDAHGND